MSDTDKIADRADDQSSALSVFEHHEPPLFSLTVRPHQALGPRGGTTIILLATAGLSPVLLFLGGSVAAWGMLPFLLAALAALYFGLKRNHLDRKLSEEIRVWRDRVAVVRTGSDGKLRSWSANPHWVEVQLRKDGPVEDYLTLRGNGREIEFGAFLSPKERVKHHAAIVRALNPR